MKDLDIADGRLKVVHEWRLTSSVSIEKTSLGSQELLDCCVSQFSGDSPCFLFTKKFSPQNARFSENLGGADIDLDFESGVWACFEDVWVALVLCFCSFIYMHPFGIVGSPHS